MIRRLIAVSVCVIIVAGIALAGVDIEKMKRKSLDMADLVRNTVEGKPQRLVGKIDKDENGFFIWCSMPDDAIKVFANATRTRIEKIGKDKYVFVSLGRGRGLIAHLKGDKLYIERAYNLASYKKELIAPPAPPAAPVVQAAQATAEPVEPAATPVEKPVEPSEAAEKPVEQAGAEEPVEPSAAVEKASAEQPAAETPVVTIAEVPQEEISVATETVGYTEGASTATQEATPETIEYPDYTEALSKIYDQYPSLSLLINYKINDMEFSEDELKENPGIEKVTVEKDGKTIIDIVYRSETPDEDIKLILDSFKAKSNVFNIDSKISLKITKTKDNKIAIEKTSK